MIDPWAGSYLMEKMTNELEAKAMEIIDEIENEHKGMSRAIESGMVWLFIKTCIG